MMEIKHMKLISMLLTHVPPGRVRLCDRSAAVSPIYFDHSTQNYVEFCEEFEGVSN